MRVAIIGLCCLLLGCTTIKYNGTTKEFYYCRFGNQKIEDLEVIKDPDITVKLGSQESKNDEIAEILGIVRRLLEKMP